MDNKYSNPCTRCGKDRIEARTWKEKIQVYGGGTTVIEYTDMICPDPECQKVVAKQIKESKKKSDAIKKDKEERVKLKFSRNKARTTKKK